MSPDFGGQYEVYEFVGDNTSYSYRITGNSDTGYQAYVDGEPVRGIWVLLMAKLCILTI
jgi:hypothetical protein